MIDLSIHELAEIRGAILHCLDEGRLVNGKREPWSFYGPGDWHMDESGDVNEQRTDFCDEVANVLLKRIKESQ
jgi:hypothetical protein